MKFNPAKLIETGKLPRDLLPWKSGLMNAHLNQGNAFLSHVCIEGLQSVDENGFGGYTVMDDSDAELSRHLNAVRHATGRVLKTGLGFGSFVRMCLTKPDVEHVDVIEINKAILEHFGSQFANNPKVTLHHADAFEFALGDHQWNFAWHDIYCDGNEGLAIEHVKLIRRYAPHCDLQGAWALDQWVRRRLPINLI